ncbi:MAG: hypothetical protein K6E32_07300 [Lachnospiraceae bacterium]|nr:hypothetical protein [Lachnospiraceae bacterium]
MRVKIEVTLVSKSKGSNNAMNFYFEGAAGKTYFFEASRDPSGNYTNAMGKLLDITTHTKFMISTEIIPKGEKRFRLYDPRIVKELD